jgi:trans-aconitate 2-methyltransferase
MAWDPGLYEQFKAPRLRPGLDLIARIPEAVPTTVVDLGCGTGRLTAALQARWPDAAVTGVDGSPEMLAQAREEFPGIAWVEADIGAWSPPAPVDLLYSNAALHWLPNHASLFPRLMAAVAPGGALAVQMPRNFGEPSHRLIRDVAGELGVAERLTHPAVPVAPPEDYYDFLGPRAAVLDIWETIYLQPLTGDDPVFQWVSGTALQPVMAALDGEEAERFAGRYRARLREAYPKRNDGVTVFPFRRLFIVAAKAG